MTLLDTLQSVLGSLRTSLSRKAENAYADRDTAREDSSPLDEAYADGEGHAYGVASDEVREAEKRQE